MDQRLVAPSFDTLWARVAAALRLDAGWFLRTAAPLDQAAALLYLDARHCTPAPLHDEILSSLYELLRLEWLNHRPHSVRLADWVAQEQIGAPAVYRERLADRIMAWRPALASTRAQVSFDEAAECGWRLVHSMFRGDERAVPAWRAFARLQVHAAFLADAVASSNSRSREGREVVHRVMRASGFDGSGRTPRPGFSPRHRAARTLVDELCDSGHVSRTLVLALSLSLVESDAPLARKRGVRKFSDRDLVRLLWFVPWIGRCQSLAREHRAKDGLDGAARLLRRRITQVLYACRARLQEPA
jgi:hypothetical protein